MTYLGFQTQIAGIIEDLANAAVAEICKVVENGYAILQLEISQGIKQNDALKRKIHLLEAQRDLSSKYNRGRFSSVNQTCKITVKKLPRKFSRLVDPPENEATKDHQMNGTPAFSSEDDRNDSDCTEEKFSDVITIKEESTIDMGNCTHVGDMEVQEHGSAVDAQHRIADVMPQMLDCKSIECDRGEHIKDENLEPAYIKGDEPHIFAESEKQDDQRDTLPEKTHDGPLTSYGSNSDTVDQHSLLNPDHNTDYFNNLHPVNSVCHEGNNSTCSYTTTTGLHQEEIYPADSFRHRSELSGIPRSTFESATVAEMPSLSAPPTTLKYPGIQHRTLKQWFERKKGGKAGPSGSSLIEHQRVHSGERRFICPVCGKSFNQASSLRKHQSIHTGEKPHRCSHCGKGFSDPSNLRKHVSIHTGERPFRCSQCGKTFNQSSNLKTHMKIHTGEKPFSCEDYGQSGGTVEVFPNVNTSKEERMVDTGSCAHVDGMEVQKHGGQTVSAQQSTADTIPQCANIHKGDHIKDENQNAYGKDDECHIFEDMHHDRRDTLTETLPTHEGPSTSYTGISDPISQHSLLNPDHDTDLSSNFPPVSSTCHEGTSFASSYTTATDLHQEEIYHADNFRHRSELSGSVALESAVVVEMPYFSAPTTLEYTGTQQKVHKQWVERKKGGKTGSVGSSLIEHQRTYLGERRFICPLCGKSFSQASSLRKHQSIHTGEKPFRCSHCGKGFSDPSNLRKHVSIHTGERPFRCSQCGKTFNQSSNLKTHMKIHTGEKPFSCEGCGQVFAYKISLVNHQLKSCLGEQNLMG